MKFLFGLLIISFCPLLSDGQCPVINATMINACATFPSVSEGINEFVLFSTTAAATAGSYTLSYGPNNPPANGNPVNNLAGINARTKNGTGTLTSTNGCIINLVTSSATVIPANSNVIFIPSNFDANYDLTSVCSTGSLYVVLININAPPSNNWNPGGTFANSSGNIPRYLQISNGANNCMSDIRSYIGNGWLSNTDGNSLWWDAAGNTVYQNNGCSTIIPPKPTITPGAIGGVCEGSASTSMPFTTTGNPDKYSIDWNNTANTAGFTDITAAALPVSPLTLNLPATAAPATYTGILTVISSLTADTSIVQNITITINAAPVISTQPLTDTQRVCQNGVVTPLSVIAAAGSGTISTYQWYITTLPNNTGGSIIPFANADTYTPSSSSIGTIYFYCKVTNSNSCSTKSNVSGPLIVSPPVTTPSAAAIKQPTCTDPTGTILVTAPAGANIQYSVGGAYQSVGTFGGLAPDSIYSVTAKNIVTGCISSIKLVTINAIPAGPATPFGTVTIQPTCLTPTGTIVITSPGGTNIQYSVGGIYQSANTFSGLTDGTTYNVTAKDTITGCISAAFPITVNTVPAVPALPTASISQQPTCTDPTGTITVTAPVGAAIEYSIGGTYQPGGIFPGLTPGAAYTVTAKDNITGCISAALPLTVNAIPNAPATPTGSITTQPTCTTPTATITLTAPSGTSIEYSVGGTYQSSGIFSGLTPGTAYIVTAKDNITGCISGALPLTVNAIPNAPATPAASITTQPTCILPTGTITVTAPSGATIEYSVGGAYKPSGLFPGLTPGTTYNVTAKDNITGCISAALPLTVNAIPNAPAAPTGSITIQPTCTVPSGTITITAPSGTNIEYSVGGSYQASGIFTTLTPGITFNVTAKDVITGCISAALPLTVNAIPNAPVTPTATITTPPDCTVPTATITVTAPSGVTIEYSAGGTYQPSGIFSGLTPGTTYNITAKDNITGCVSAALPLTVNAIPGVPATPTASVTTQPSCIKLTGTITVTAPAGANIHYSIGGAYQPSGVFSGLTPGVTYFVTAKDISLGCVSAPFALTVNLIPNPPAAPTASVTKQPTCITTSGTITVTAPTGVAIQYSNGGAYQSSGIFSGLAPGSSYFITAKDTATGCISAVSSLIVDAVPNPPNTPVASVSTQPSCAIPTGTITVTLPAGINIQYSIGGAYQPGGVFAGLAPGASYSIRAKDTLTGCISAVLILNTGNVPVTPAPAAIAPVTYCQNALAVPLTIAGSNLLWYATSTSITPLSAAPTPLTAVPGNTFYYVTQTINGCESPRRAITVTVNAVSTAVSGFRYNPDTVCINSNNPGPVYDLGFTIGGNFSATPAGLSINPNTGNINLAASSTGTYSVTYTYNTTGCVTGSLSNSAITILPAVPTVTVFSYTSPVCKNAPDPGPNLRAGFTSGGKFSSSQGLVINSSTGIIDVANSLPGTYQVTYNITALGCRLATSNFSFITIVDTTAPVTEYRYSPSNVCISSGTNPTLIKAPGFTTGGGTFSSTPAGLSINPATGNISIGLSVPGIYTITYTVPSFVCRLAGSYTTTFTITAYSNPVTGFSYFSPVCKGDDTAIPVPVSGFFSGGVFSSTAGLAIDSLTGVLNLTQSIAGNYLIRYDVAQGVCNPAGSGTATIHILTQPAPPEVTPAAICGAGIVNLSAAGLGTIGWFTEPRLLNQINVGNTYSTLLNSTTAFYITNTIGTCTSEAAILNVTVSPIPAPPFLGRDTAICTTDKLILNASGPYNSYLWQDGSIQPTLNVTHTGIYSVSVSTGAGCETSSSIRINVLDNCDDINFPTAFTPNGDGLNDRFGPAGNLFLVKNYTLKLFNRYGETVFSSSNPYERWDGNYRGKQNGTNNYVWVASYIYHNRVAKTQKGNLTVVQ